jgi:uncharacterized protein with NRDE domain
VCTRALPWQAFEDAPVVVAANRDERLNRESEPPAVRDWETPTVAPQDAEAGGTWLGYNEHGVLVAITNRWLDEELTAGRSRGLLVRDALRHESAEDAARYVERELEAHSYDGFNLLAVDDAAAVLVEWVGSPRVRTLDPGVHVVVNVGADGAYTVPSVRPDAGREQARNADTLRTALRPEPGETGREWLDRAGAAIGDHDHGVCVHGDGFGTRSSSLVYIPEDGQATYEFADGPPCETPFERVDAVL